MSDNANVGRVFNLTGGGGSGGSLKLVSLTITNPPDKTTYKSGQSFDPTGMVVTADYGYGLTSDVTGYTVTPAILTDGVKEVTITYTEGRVTKTASTPVTVEKVLVSIAITTPPTKTTYNYLEKFQPDGMTVTAEFSDGSTSVATGYTYPTTEFSSLGQQTINLEYAYEGVSKSTSLEITANPIELPVPTQKDVPSYDGTSKTPVWNGFDSVKMAVIGETMGINAGGYTAKFSLVYGYVFPNGTREADAEWTIQRAIISAVPTQSGTLAADGTPKSPSWNGYDPDKMSIGGDRTGSNPGDYTANFTPTANYMWWDGTTTAKDAPWVIASILVTVPTQKDIPTYDGTKKTPAWNNFDEEHSAVQVTAMTDAGEYGATFSLLMGMWTDGTTAPKTVVWSINRATIAAVPKQTSVPTYDGNPKTPSWDSNYSSVKMTVSVEAAVNAGTNYTASFTPTANYQWWDGTIGAKSVTWTINRGVIAALPKQVNIPTYNGKTHRAEWDSNYDANKIESTFNLVFNAGEYQQTMTPKSNYQWWDGTTESKVATWIIRKSDIPNQVFSDLTSSLTLTKDTYVFNFSQIFGLDTSFNITCSSSNSAVAMASFGRKYSIIVESNGPNGLVTGQYQFSRNCLIIQSPRVPAIATSGEATITIHFEPKDVCNFNTTPDDIVVHVKTNYVFIYGVEWDWTSSGQTKGVRTDDAANFSDPDPAVNNGTGSSPFDNLMPWAGMVKETRTGGVMVKEPKYWFKWTKTGKKLKLQIANGPVDGFHVDPVNMDKGDGLGELDYSYIGRYHCATSTYKSETNKAQQIGTRSAARTAIHNLGANIWQIDFAQMWYLGMLFLVEFADWNGERIGRGCSASGSKENNGKTDAMQYHTGTTAANRNTYGFTQYRNIEGWWDNVFDWMDGCYYNSNGLNVILDPSKFSDTENGTPVGLPVEGYPSNFAIPTQNGLEWALYPSAVDGSVTSYVPDNWDYNGSKPCLCHGGGYDQAMGRGPFCVDCYNALAGFSDSGCRLQERPPKAA